MIHAAHAKATQAIEQHIAPGYEAGPIRQIRCDNGTNFIGAKSELSKAFDEMDQSVISSKMNQMGIEWIFNPPAASHMGGVWERQTRSVRKILAGILHENGEQLDDESFRTMLCEVEAIVNSRPLTFPSTDPNDLNPISPSRGGSRIFRTLVKNFVAEHRGGGGTFDGGGGGELICRIDLVKRLSNIVMQFIKTFD